MREAIKDRGRLEHMLSAIDNVEEFTKDISLDDFVKSKVLFFAVGNSAGRHSFAERAN